MHITKQKVWGPVRMSHNNFIFYFIIFPFEGLLGLKQIRSVTDHLS